MERGIDCLDLALLGLASVLPILFFLNRESRVSHVLFFVSLLDELLCIVEELLLVIFRP